MASHKKPYTGYSLTRSWFDFAASNYGKVSPTDGILFLYIVDVCNGLNWKPQFGLRTNAAMEAIGVKNWRTYKKSLDNLIEWKFIEMIKPSTNQNTANVVAIVWNTEADAVASTEADAIVQQEQIQQQVSSAVDVDKQKNHEPEKPSKPETLETNKPFLQSGEKSTSDLKESESKESRVSFEPPLSKKETTEAVDVQTLNWGSDWPSPILESAKDFIQSRSETKHPMTAIQIKTMASGIERFLAEGGDEFALLSNIDSAIIGGHQTFFFPKLD